MKKKITRHTKRETKFEKIEQTPELDSDMTEMLDYQIRNLKEQWLLMLRTWMDKVDSTISKAVIKPLPQRIQPFYTFWHCNEVSVVLHSCQPLVLFKFLMVCRHENICFCGFKLQYIARFPISLYVFESMSIFCKTLIIAFTFQN